MASDTIVDDDLEFAEPSPLIPDGAYMATCIAYSKPVPFRGTRKLFLTFEVLTTPYEGTRLLMAFNLGFGRIARGSKYFKCWTIANGNKPPSRNAKASPRMFLNKHYKIITRTVKPKIAPTIRLVNDPGMHETELDSGNWYSIVDYFELAEEKKVDDSFMKDVDEWWAKQHDIKSNSST